MAPRAKPLPRPSPADKAVLDRHRANQKMAAVVDGFQNVLTGVGTSRSKTSAGGYVPDDILTPPELETLFECNDLAAKIVAKPVEDALRDGFSLRRRNAKPGTFTEESTAILDRLKELDLREAVKRGGAFGRLLGGAGSVLGVAGGGALDTPLDDTKVTRVERLLEWTRQEMVATEWELDGTASVYWWSPTPKGGRAIQPMRIHRSRLLVYPGALTTPRSRSHNQYWDLSVLQRVLSALRSFDGMFASTDAMFADASQAVFRLQGLIQGLAEADGEGQQDVQTRLAMMDVLRSTAKAIVLDAGDETGRGAEDFSVVDRATLGTLDKVIGQYYVRLAAAANMPLTVLLGMAPQGMNATGESDMVLYFNTVDAYRRDVLEPRILRVVRMVAQELGDTQPKDWEVVWPELARPKPLDVATAEKMKVDSLVALVGAQVLLPEEIALALSASLPNLGIVIDTHPRELALAEAYTEIENREMTGAVPEPPVPEGPKGAVPAGKTSGRKVKSETAGASTE